MTHDQHHEHREKHKAATKKAMIEAHGVGGRAEAFCHTQISTMRANVGQMVEALKAGMSPDEAGSILLADIAHYESEVAGIVADIEHGVRVKG